jgi:hypothetical protein
MLLPDELKRTIDAAAESLARAPNGELILPMRKRIWAALGPCLVEGQRALPGAGLTRRGALAISCSRHVLPIWENALRDDRRPHDALEAAQRRLEGAADFDSAERIRGALWTYCDGLFGRVPDRCVYVGYSAALSVATALHDELFELDDLDSELDRDLDPYQWDASFYASAACAGFGWEPDSDPVKRREFWQWYLATAVPAAWHVEVTAGA